MIKFHIFFSVSCLSLFHIFPSKSLLITSHHRHPDLYCPPSSVHCASPLVSVLFCFLSLIFYTYVPLLASCSSITRHPTIHLSIYLSIYLFIYLSIYSSIYLSIHLSILSQFSIHDITLSELVSSLLLFSFLLSLH